MNVVELQAGQKGSWSPVHQLQSLHCFLMSLIGAKGPKGSLGHIPATSTLWAFADTHFVHTSHHEISLEFLRQAEATVPEPGHCAIAGR